MIGQTLGHYRIVEKIGAGGTGEVYRAHDEHLDRDVALKILPAGTLVDEAARKRFRNEALALSKLNHPNIATVHDFDTQGTVDFLVMECVPGVTLSKRLAEGSLPEREVVLLGMQLAEGLTTAHREGVVHRDLKPGNLRVTPDDRLKILDFGLAKLLAPAADATVTAETLMEAHGAAGTLPYMAPEQLRGEPPDARGDIYAAGVVLYEMATGQRPFPETHGLRLIDSILHQPPLPPSSVNRRVSPALEQIVLKCLEKEPENRYQSAKELVVDLRRLGTATSASAVQYAPPARIQRKHIGLGIGLALITVVVVVLVKLTVGGGWGRTPTTRIDSLAVLPLENLSRDSEQNYFVDGMTEQLIAVLSQISALKVISRTSVMQYKGAKKPLPQIAKELNVAAVVEGSVLKVSGRVRITVQLIEAATDRHLWARSYDRDLKDVLTLQDDVARAIAQEIQIKLNPQEATRLARAQSVNPEAYEAYLKGRYFWNQRDRESIMKGLTYFQQAIEMDPTYALAYVGVADSFVVLGFDQWLSPVEAFPRARQAALKALALDSSLAEAHTSLASLGESEWDWTGAETEFKRALELNPNYAVAHQWYSYFLSRVGRHEEALAQARRAAELDPVSPIINTNEVQILYMARRYDEARQRVLKTLEVDPNFFPARYYLGVIDVQKGMFGEGIAELQRAASLSSGNDVAMATLGYAYARSGRKEDALRIFNKLKEQSKRKYVSAYLLALSDVSSGRKEEAIKSLEKAYAEHDSLILWTGTEPMLDPLRSDPRFQDLLRRMQLRRGGPAR